MRHMSQRLQDLPLLIALANNVERSTASEDRTRVLVRSKTLLDRNEPRKAVIFSAALTEERDECYFYLFHTTEAALSERETIDSLRASFMRGKHADAGLGALSRFRALTRTDTDYFFSDKDHGNQLASMFSSDNLSHMQRSQQGEIEFQKSKAQKAGEDPDIPVGYRSVEDFVSDQPSIYSHPFHS